MCLLALNDVTTRAHTINNNKVYQIKNSIIQSCDRHTHAHTLCANHIAFIHTVQ